MGQSLIRACVVCGRSIWLSRLMLHPGALTCGGGCQTANRERVHRGHARRSQRRKRAADRLRAA